MKEDKIAVIRIAIARAMIKGTTIDIIVTIDPEPINKSLY